ncbi:MAG: hypothetical protein WAT27_09425 [Chitinophagales bacterium]
MKKSIIISILAITSFWSCGQRSNSKSVGGEVEFASEDSLNNNNGQLLQHNELARYIYTDTTYTTSTGKRITIQNSLPKGGSIEPNGNQYFDASGKFFAFAAFWTRVINETNFPLELNINFPADSFTIFSPKDSYLKLFLPPDTFTYDKIPLYNFGITGIKSFLDNNFNKATTLHKTINPNDEYVFYVAALTYQALGTPRAALILNEQNLYYEMSISPNDSGIVPCGMITFKEKMGD